MSVITPNQALWIGFVIAPILFGVSAYFTHAGYKRILAALAAAIVYGFANFLWDQAAFRMGWWSYPAFQENKWWPLLYVPSGLVAGGAFGFIGWRVNRRYGIRELVIFLLLWSLWGIIHDAGGGTAFQSSRLMTFAPGVAPIVADGILYATCQMAAQAVLYLVGGPAKGDPLRGSLLE